MKLDTDTIKAIERILDKDDRVELIPQKDGAVTVIHIRREKVNI